MFYKGRRSIAFLGSYLPRKCGIATFNSDVSHAVAKEIGPFADVFAIAMTNNPETYAYPEEVKFEIRDQVATDYEHAADFINSSKVDILCVQHEYGIYGGQWGEYLNIFLRKLKIPIVTVLHTVLDEFKDDIQKRTFEELVQRSSRIIVMSHRSREMLIVHGVPENDIVYIPHGIPDFSFDDPDKYKTRFDLQGKKMAFTFGLLRESKGIEIMIDAMGQLVSKYPDLVYVILGVTHPGVVKKYGEEYRHMLMRQVEKLGIQKNVFFHDRFVSLEELCEYISAADFYVVPYLIKEQIMSGTLCYTIGAGNAVISTPSWCAEELLDEGRGKLVPFNDPGAFADAIDGLIQDPKALMDMRKKAYNYGRDMVWPSVARQYIKIFDDIQKRRVSIVAKLQQDEEPILSTVEFPIPKLAHLGAMTDDFGLFQNARYTIPAYDDGYSVDDNARAIVVAAKFYRLVRTPEALALLQKYLAFVFYSQGEDGSFRNFHSVTKEPLDEKGSDDCQGRALWGLGYIIGYGPANLSAITKVSFDKALLHVFELKLRGSAYALLGCYYYLVHFPESDEVRDILKKLADKLIKYYEENAEKNWSWFEDKISYVNGLMPAAMWVAYYVMEEDKYREVAEASSNFLIKRSLRDGHISLVGRDNWSLKGDKETEPSFVQKPIDALWMVELGKFAYRCTKEDAYLRLMQKSFDWFLGINDTDTAVYDRVTGGCYDGLNKEGTNLNQGAESTLSAVLALLSITEMAHQQESVRGKKK